VDVPSLIDRYLLIYIFLFRIYRLAGAPKPKTRNFGHIFGVFSTTHPFQTGKNYILHMKFAAILVLSLSLLITSTFAVSLTPPQVYAVKEDRSMASNIDTSNTFSPLKALVAGTSIGLTIGRLGMMGLRITGMVWSF
jgi:hypothetical protein